MKEVYEMNGFRPEKSRKEIFSGTKRFSPVFVTKKMAKVAFRPCKMATGNLYRCGRCLFQLCAINSECVSKMKVCSVYTE